MLRLGVNDEEEEETILDICSAVTQFKSEIFFEGLSFYEKGGRIQDYK